MLFFAFSFLLPSSPFSCFRINTSRVILQCMDPVTTIGVVAAAINFVDFGLKTCSACREISAKGSTAEHLDLERRSKTLRRLTETLRKSVSSNDKRIKDLCIKCVRTASDLEELLDDIKAKSKGPIHAVKTYTKTLAKSARINRLERELREYRELLDTSILASL